MITRKLHHVAYRCNNAQETVDFYTKVLDMPYVMAISEDRVPSTHEPDPYMHIFFDIGDGSYLAFFEIPNSPPMGKDKNTPNWVQHLAMEVADEDALLAAKERIEGFGIDVVGPTDHALFKSIYCFDPNGHRLELACNTAPPEVWADVAEAAPDMLAQWNETHSVVKHVAWIHEKEFSNA
jgi:catechol 2,3-dioxygenase-like lactoylglutathione lyase family enzyme